MLGFCENCHNITECFIKEVDKTAVIKGKVIKYKGKEAYCIACGEVLFVSELRDYNLYALEEAYRKQEGLVSVLDIKRVLEKYSNEKEKLLSILEIDEEVLSRYLSGDIPQRKHSDLLKRVLESLS